MSTDLHAQLDASVRARPDGDHWRHIEGFPWYRVNRLGEVAGPRRILRPNIIRNGYARVELHRSDGAVRRFLVHILVAEAFLGPKPPGQQVNHLDGDRSNCALSNLEYVTPSQNMRHAYDVLGRRAAVGSKIAQSRLTEATVREMRSRYDAGELTTVQVAAAYGICESSARKITKRQSWKFPEAEPGWAPDLAVAYGLLDPAGE